MINILIHIQNIMYNNEINRYEFFYWLDILLEMTLLWLFTVTV